MQPGPRRGIGVPARAGCSLAVVDLLFVCTGNVCRSPIAERLARAFLDDALGAASAAVGTASAGTHAVVGSDMEPSSALTLRGLGGEPFGFGARQLTGEMVDAAHLTLTMTRRHRHEVLKLAPRAMFRTYTLREAADLLSGVDVAALPPVSDLDQRAAALAMALGAQRATRRRSEREVDDVDDPMGRRAAAHEEAGDRIFGGLIPLLQALCGHSATAASSEARPTARPAAPPRLCDDTVVVRHRSMAPPVPR